MLITTLARLRSCQLLLYLLYLAATISGCPTEHRRPIVGSPSYFEGGDSEYRPPPQPNILTEVSVIFLSPRPTLGPTQSPIKWVPGALSLGGKATGT